MQSLRQIGTGILLAVISIAVILGGFMLATAEGPKASSAQPGSTFQPEVLTANPTFPTNPGLETETPQPEVSTLTPEGATQQMTPVPSVTAIPTQQNPSTTPEPTLSYFPTAIPSPSLTLRPGPSVCPQPAGWIAIVIQPYDTLTSLAQYYEMTLSTIMQGNCLTNDQLQAGTLLYIIPRPVPSPRATFAPCGAPLGWIDYYVVRGDTLFNIGWRYRVTVEELQRANCLGGSTNIQVGRWLKVPNVATTEPFNIPTATFPPTYSPAPTANPLPTATTEPTIAPVPTEIPEIPTATPYSGIG